MKVPTKIILHPDTAERIKRVDEAVQEATDNAWDPPVSVEAEDTEGAA